MGTLTGYNLLSVYGLKMHIQIGRIISICIHCSLYSCVIKNATYNQNVFSKGRRAKYKGRGYGLYDIPSEGHLQCWCCIRQVAIPRELTLAALAKIM